MSRLHLTVLFGACLLAQPLLQSSFAAAQEDDDGQPAFDEKDVVVLTAESFDSTIAQHKFAMSMDTVRSAKAAVHDAGRKVEFYAPWCGHCKSLAPEYAEAATALKAHDATIMLGKVDATVHGDLAQKFGVQGYPTIKWFVDGTPMEYEVPRDADGIIKWVKKKTGPASVRVTAAADLTKLTTSEEVVVVGYFKKYDSDEHKAFLAAAQLSTLTFVETDVAAVGKVAGLSKPGVAVVQHFKDEATANVPYTGSATSSEDLAAFVIAESMPLTLPFTAANTDKIFSSGIPRHVLIIASPADLAKGSALMKEFNGVAKALKGKFVFVTVDAESEDAEPVFNFFSLARDALPTVVGFVMEPKQQRYSFKDAITTAAMTKFASGILDGSVKPEVKSAEIPAEATEDGVTVVVGKSFDAVCKDEAKDVLLETLAPIYAQLAKRFSGIESIVIAKFDGTENEHPDLDIQGFPSLMLFPAKGGAVIQYEGDRALSGLTAFLRENAKVAFELTITPEQEAADEAAAALAAAEAGGGEEYGGEDYEDTEDTPDGMDDMEMEMEHQAEPEETDEPHDEM